MSGLMIIGERPGPEECEKGDPFIGRSGDWIGAGLGGERVTGEHAMRLWKPYNKPVTCLGCPLYDKGQSFVPGCGNERVFVSNVRRCLHEGETEDEWIASKVQCVRAHLEAELEAAQPRALLLVGDDALHAVTGLKGSQKYHMSVWHRAAVDEIRRALGVTVPALPPSIHTVVFTLHPAHAMRAGIPQLKPTITLSVLRAKRWAERTAGLSMDWHFDLDLTPDDLAEYLAGVTSAAVDVETDHEDHSKIVLCGASARDGHAVSTPWTPDFIEVWREFLSRPGVVKWLHNSPFDRKAFAAWGVEVVPPVRDTIQMAALLHPPFKGAERMRWLNLPSCSMRMIDGLANWKDTEKPETRAYFRAMFPHVPEFLHSRLYNGIDCIVTRMLAQIQEETLKMEGMW